MQYNLFCLITKENYLWLKLSGYNPELSKYDGYYYIASYLEPEWLQFTIMELNGHIEGIKTTEKRLTAKQMDYQYTLRNIQYRIERLTKRILTLI